MKKKKNIFAKVMAAVALFAIVVGIVGTWILVIVNSFSSPSINETEISSEELQKIVENLPEEEINTDDIEEEENTEIVEDITE